MRITFECENGKEQVSIPAGSALAAKTDDRLFVSSVFHSGEGWYLDFKCKENIDIAFHLISEMDEEGVWLIDIQRSETPYRGELIRYSSTKDIGKDG